jgi:hypothetical protein
MGRLARGESKDNTEGGGTESTESTEKFRVSGFELVIPKMGQRTAKFRWKNKKAFGGSRTLWLGWDYLLVV